VVRARVALPPVRLRIEQDAQTYVELLIARKPEISGPVIAASLRIFRARDESRP
jgi:hypothetical protein